jgi:hypothetical protein
MHIIWKVWRRLVLKSLLKNAGVSIVVALLGWLLLSKGFQWERASYISCFLVSFGALQLLSLFRLTWTAIYLAIRVKKAMKKWKADAEEIMLVYFSDSYKAYLKQGQVFWEMNLEQYHTSVKAYQEQSRITLEVWIIR